MTKPLVPYHGGKGRLADWIVSLIPPHRVYVEPFAGSAAVLLAKPRSTHEVLNDVDGNVVCFYRVLREQPDELERVCRLTPYSREEFALADLHDAGLTDLERARRWWVRVTQGFAQKSGLCTGWSTSVNMNPPKAAQVPNRILRFAEIAERLAQVTIENADALEVIARYGAADAVVYADPPYLRTTRVSHDAYEHEFNSEDDHRRLADVLRFTPATVLLSGYDSPLYAELYDGWVKTGRRVLKRSSNGRSASQVHATEVIWSNRPLSEDLLTALGQETA